MNHATGTNKSLRHPFSYYINLILVIVMFITGSEWAVYKWNAC